MNELLACSVDELKESLTNIQAAIFSAKHRPMNAAVRSRHLNRLVVRKQNLERAIARKSL